MFSCGAWADLPLNLVCRIGDGLDDLKCYASAQRTFPIWRSALTPPSRRCSWTTATIQPSAASPLPSSVATVTSILMLCSCGLYPIPSGKLCPAACRSFKLITIPSVRTCLGCRGAWLSLSICIADGHSLLSLFHPVMATEILLPPLIYDRRLVSKMVFTPNPPKDDFLAAVICDINGFARVTAGAKRWAILDSIRLNDGDQITDLLYHRNGMVYCLTRF